MNAQHLELLQQISKIRHISKGESVFCTGQAAEAIFKVNKGEVHLHRHELEGQRVLLCRAYDGHFFAEASLDHKVYHCTATCMKDTQVQVINSQQMISLLKSNPRFSLAWISHISSDLRHLRASVERMNIKTAAEKVRHYLLSEGSPCGELTLTGTLIELAEILGLSRESLYRTLSDMQKHKKIERTANKIKLLD